MRTVAASVLLVLSTLTGASARAELAPSTATGRIAFVTNRSPNLYRALAVTLEVASGRKRVSDLGLPRVEWFLRSADGSRIAYSLPGYRSGLFVRSYGQRPVRIGPADLYLRFENGQVPNSTDVAFSSDGSRIAFVAQRACLRGYCHALYTARSDGRLLRRLANGGRHPAWSADGKLLAYELWEEDDPVAVVVSRSDASGRRRVGLGDSPVWSPQGRLLAYRRRVSEREQAQPWIADLTSGRQTRLASARTSAPVWRPDGQRLAFAARAGLYTARADGRERRLLIAYRKDGPTYVPLAWSPEGGKLLAEGRSRERGWQFAVLSARTGARLRVTREPVYAALISDARWLVSDQISYSSYLFANDYELATINSDGSDVRILTRSAGDERTPSWAPTGTQIAFSRTDRCPPSQCVSLYAIRADGSGLRQLTPPRPGRYDQFPTWSPDGSELAFVRDGAPTGRSSLMLLPSGGGEPRTLVADVYRGRVSWSPDGRRIAYTSYTPRYPQVFTIGRDGANARQITSEQYGASDPVWSRDGGSIVYRGAFSSGPELQFHVLELATASSSAFTIPAAKAFGDWAPDGTRFVYVTARPDFMRLSGAFDFEQVAVAATTGGAPTLLTQAVGSNTDANSWVAR